MKGFKEFTAKGNVMDLAVGVIIGGAFGKIVTSLVGDVLMPLIGIVLGKVNFTELKILISEGDPEVAIYYGRFIQNIVDFLIIAFCVYLMVQVIANFRKKEEKAQEEPAPEEPAQDIVLLTEIRDLLKNDK